MDPTKFLERYWGQGFCLRSHQPEIVSALSQGQDVLALLPTGEGKSLCYQLAGLMKGGVTLVISPLVALMQDQVHGLEKRGIPVFHLHSQLHERNREQGLKHIQDSGGFVYLSPEQLQSRSVQAFFWQHPPQIIVIDEAHCITQWGHDFRPAYRRIPDFIAHLPIRPVIGAFTATAPPRVAHDIAQLLQLKQALCIKGNPLQEHIDLALHHSWTPRGKKQALMRYLRDKTLIYASSRQECDTLAQSLSLQVKHKVLSYHAGLSGPKRAQSLAAFATGQTGIMVATKAFGMGVDIGDIERVIHWQLPESLSAYVQEVGRAGRNRQQAASGVLLTLWQEKPPSETMHHLQRLQGEQIRSVLKALQEGCSSAQLQQRFQLPESTLNQILLPLEQNGQLEKTGSLLHLQSEVSPLLKQELQAHIRQLALQRKQESAQVKAYTRFRRCRRQFLNQVFDLPAPTESCGHCDRCQPRKLTRY